MEEDSLLDDDILVKETPPQSVVTPGTFSKNLIHRLGLSQQPRSETANNDNNDNYSEVLISACICFVL